MTVEEIFERVKEVLVESFELDPGAVQASTHLFEDLDLDSIDAIDLVVGLQEETGLDFSEDELKSIRRVQDVVDLIRGKLAGE